MAVTRIKNNQIFDKTITAAKIADGTLVGTLFNPNLTLNSNITVTGNLHVMGDSSTVSSTNTYVNDPIIVFNNGFTGSPTYDVGILVNRNLSGNVNTAWIWNETESQFEGIFTTETGGTVGTINNSGFATIKGSVLKAAQQVEVANVVVSGNEVHSLLANLNLTVTGAGSIVGSANILPSANSTYSLGTEAYKWSSLHVDGVQFGTTAHGALVNLSGDDLVITPVGNTVIANLQISGTGSTFTGSIDSANVNITGGSINGTVIGNVTPADGSFTSVTTANAQITGGAITNTPVTATVLTTGNAQITGGAITLTPISGSTVSATVLTTGNAQITGGAVSGVAITNSPISGSTGSFTTLAVSGNTTLSGTNVTVSGLTNITDTTQSTAPTNGALVVAGGVGVGKDVSVGGNVRVAQSSTLGNIVIDGNSISAAEVDISATGAVKIGTLTYPQTDGTAGSFMMSDGAGNLTLVSASSAAAGNVIPLGTPTVGTLVDNTPAITTFTTATKVTDAVDQLNEILGKLVPPAPPVFPNSTTIAISSLSSGLRMTDFTQTDNTASQGHSLAGGSTVSAYRRAATYTTNTINDVGPGNSGTVSVQKNGVAAGSHTMVAGTGNNGTYSDLIISDNADYGTKTSTALNFWTSFDASASGTVSEGWNEVALTDTAGTSTNTPVWYYDASAPGTPVVTSSTFTPTAEATSDSSSVPHYTSSTVWTGTGTATRLSGDLYPASNTFLSGVSGGSFQAPASVTYAAAGVTTPLARSLYVASGSATFSTTVSTVNSTGSSSAGPSYSVSNSYATGTGSASPGGIVLTINTSDTSKVNENNIVVGSFGSGGSASAVRIGGLATGATPTLSGMTAWASSAALAAYEATVVAGIAKQDTTNYSTGYFPVGPDLSTGRSATQYITFRIQRDATSKFDIAITGKISGCQVAMPGSSLDTTAAPTNGWIDPTVSYGGAGVPGTGTGGNGSVGCGLGGTLTVGSTLTQSKTVTFGTESSNNSTNNYIYVRFALASGDSITALSFANPTH